MTGVVETLLFGAGTKVESSVSDAQGRARDISGSGESCCNCS